MEFEIVSSALFFVMFLLLLVVYDSNPTLRRTAMRLLQRGGKGEKKDKGKAIVEQVEPFPEQQQDQVVPFSVEMEGKKGQSNVGMSRLMRAIHQRDKTAVEMPEEVFLPSDKLDQNVEKKSRGILVRLFEAVTRGGVRDEEMEEMVMSALDAIRNTIDELGKRVAQAEMSMGKVGQLEEGLTKAEDNTQMVSEEMKGILGSIRVSIDGLGSRLDELNSEIQEVKDREPKIVEPQSREIEIVDEETKNKVKRLEEALADANEVLGSLPEKVEEALSNSTDIGERLEVVSGNLQSTLGFSIRKAFRCESCGSSGYVASQVTCSKCGAGSWWGWWPEGNSEDEEPEYRDEELGETFDVDISDEESKGLEPEVDAIQLGDE